MRLNLKNARKNNDWTQQYVADAVDVKLRTYQHYESGDRSPSKPIIDKLEDLFGIPQRKLLQLHYTEGETNHAIGCLEHGGSKGTARTD